MKTFIHTMKLLLKPWQIPSYRNAFCIFLGILAVRISFMLAPILHINIKHPYQEPVAYHRSTEYIATVNARRISDIDWSRQAYEKERIRIYCYVNTIPQTRNSRAMYVRNTFLRHCTKFEFMSTVEDPDLPTVNLNLTEIQSRQHLWSKMRTALRYVYPFADQYDYFLKLDDDSHVFLENLRQALAYFDPNEPLMFGYPFTHIVKEGHLSGGAGYVFSRAGLKLLIEKAIDKHPECPTYDGNFEDVKISQCGYAVGIRFVQLIDRHTVFEYRWRLERWNQYRFQWRSIQNQHSPYVQKYKEVIGLPEEFDPSNPFIKNRTSLLSELLISNHYVRGYMHYAHQLLLYHIRPIGIVYIY